jgi:glycosyltransferase involved in cell wall biosynthesis
MQASNSFTCTCIVPFYNESLRIISVIDSLTRVKSLSEIICVDDGSVSPATANEIAKKFPKVTLLRLKKNSGKSAAVQAGLARVKTSHVMLMDADLGHVIPDEIERVVSAILKDPNVDMVIFRRLSDPWFSKIIRGETLTSGERILRISDFQNIFKSHPHKYQLEFAINFYMMKNKKNVYWMPYSAENDPKMLKRGAIRGLLQELVMYNDMLRFAGAWMAIKSIFTFCKKEYK